MKILVCDDEQLIREVIKEYLLIEGYDGTEAENGLQAMEFVKQQDFDLMIMDIMMPKMNGIETLRRLKEIDGFDIPVVALTADAIEGTDEKYLKAGFHAYLSKPIDKYDLDKVLKKYLGE